MAKKKLYELTPEHRAQLDPWRDKWIANALNTERYTASDRERAVAAVNGLYEAAGLPRPEHVVFAPSPLVTALAGCFSAAIWYMRENAIESATHAATDDATWEATDDATRDATWYATRAATVDATWAATRDATVDATWEATGEATDAATWAATGETTDAATRAATVAATGDAIWAATRDATRAATGDATRSAIGDATRAAIGAATVAATGEATHAATWDATRDATWAATRDATVAATRAATWDATGAATWDATWAATRDATRAATEAATRDATVAATGDGGELSPAARFMLECCSGWYRMWDGGNQWSGYPSYLSFFRHVAKLDLDYSRWQHYETLAEFGPRIMHPKFCIITERPLFIHRDSENRPHCDTGPFTAWSDGWCLWMVHGVRVTEQIVMRPETLTVEQIMGEENAEVRRVMIERFGIERFMQEAEATVVSEDDFGRLLEIQVPNDEPLVMVEVVNSTAEPDGSFKNYMLRVAPDCRPLGVEGADPQERTPVNAVASTFGLTGEQYRAQLLVQS
jgi:hypothetical protein